jgi:hypothetical protein
MIGNDIQFANGLNSNCTQRKTFLFLSDIRVKMYRRTDIHFIKYLIIEECAKHKLYLQFQILTCDKIIMDVCPAVHFNPDIRQK